MAKGYSQKMWRRTMIVTALLIFVGFGAVVVNLFRWQIVRGEEMKIKALDQSLANTELTAKRGTIYDVTGEKVLAKSASVWRVALEPNYIKNDETRQKIAAGLSPILNIDESEILEKAKKKVNFIYLGGKVESDVRTAILNWQKDTEIYQGIRLLDDYKRYYPYGTVASTVLGFTGTEHNGLQGLEVQYDKELRGTAGRMVNAKNAIGRDMPFQYEQLMAAENGYDLVLTIDEKIQSILEKHLEIGVDKYVVQNGAVAIMMDVDTGAILGLANKGDFDPNDPFTIHDEKKREAIELLPEDQQDQEYSNALYKQWRIKAVNDLYYPGSVFKIVTGSMGLEEGIVTAETTFTCTGAAHIQGLDRPISCWKTSGHGLQTFAEGMCNSCNPFFIDIGQRLGPDVFFRYFEAFGFTKKTGIDLPGESGSVYYTAETLKPVELATESMGQNFGITPIQMITAVSTVANGGNLVQPHIVDRMIDQDGNIIKKKDTTYKRQVISPDTAAILADILHRNAESGTADNGGVIGYQIAGKTGTSEKIDLLGKDPKRGKQYIASYCGYAPKDDPRYALLVFFDEPDYTLNGGLSGGNAVAGPVFQKMMEEILPYLNVKRQYSEDEQGLIDISAPNVTGFTLKEAIAVLKESGLSHEIIGAEADESIVTEQIPGVDVLMPNDGTVILYTDGEDVQESVTVPDFSELSLVEASSLANEHGLQIRVKGSTKGSVDEQGIAPGESVSRGTVIELTFINNVVTDVTYNIGE